MSGIGHRLTFGGSGYFSRTARNGEMTMMYRASVCVGGFYVDKEVEVIWSSEPLTSKDEAYSALNKLLGMPKVRWGVVEAFTRPDHWRPPTWVTLDQVEDEETGGEISRSELEAAWEDKTHGANV